MNSRMKLGMVALAMVFAAAGFAINLAKPVAAAKIPVLLIYGGQDQTLDPELNSRLFIPRFRKAGGDITVIYRAYCGHHPHGVEVNETTIKDFFEK